MKKYKFLILLVFCFTSFSIKSQNHSFHSENNGLSKLIDLPVSPYTGTFSYSIPLGTITAGSLSLPVSINYHSAGNKVGEAASCVGLGWMINTGGNITRTINGVHDEYIGQGYWSDPTPNNSTLNSDQRLQLYNGNMDGEPDIFTWTAGNEGGKFYIDRNKNVKNISLTDCLISCEFNPSNYVVKITIVLKNGDRYVFISGMNASGDDFAGDGYILSKVLSFDLKDSIVLKYPTYQHKYFLRHLEFPTFYGSDPNAMQAVNSNPYFKTINYTEKMVDSIIGFGNKMSFVYMGRRDLGINNGFFAGKIDAINYESGSHCIQYKLKYDYLKDVIAGDTLSMTWDQLRLRLKSVQKINCTNPSVFNEPPIKFEYYGSEFFPNFLSKDIDHLGYYNGAANPTDCNLIEPTVMFANGLVFSKRNANRNPDFENTKLGMLKKITLPTKGTIEYTYEINQYWENGSDTPFIIGANICSSNTLPAEASLFITPLMKNSSYLILEGYFDPYDYNCMGSPRQTQLTIFNSNNQLIYTYVLNVSGSSSVQILLSGISALTPNNTYLFKISSTYCDGKCTFVNNYTGMNVNFPGLRIKQIKISDGINTPNDIIKNYDYSKFSNSTQSSGSILSKPTYGFIQDANPDWVYFVAHSSFSLNELDGFAIGYENVTIDYNGIGKEYLTFSKGFQTTKTAFPKIPIQVTNTGNNTLDEVKDNSNNLVSSESMAYTESNSDSDWFHACHLLINEYRPYKIKQYRFPRVTSVTSNLDGVITTKTNSYDLNTLYPILSPIATTFYNSDNKITTVRAYFTCNYSLDGYSQAYFRWKNINIPYETKVEVDLIPVDGSRTEYGVFDGVPRPSCEKRYECTWDANGQLGTGVWNTKRYYLSYGANGKLATYNDFGYNTTTLTYNNYKLIQSENYLNQTKTYEYFTNSNLLKKVTDIDNTTKSFSYDELLRLKTEVDDCKLITKTYNYYFSPAGNSNKHKLTETITFGGAANPNSSLNTIINITYLDDLNREIQKIRQAQSPIGKDIATSIEYDKYGRVIKEYLPVESSLSTGDFMAIQSSWKNKSISFEMSPLSRILSETPPDWYSTNYVYGSNINALDGVIIDYKNNSTFPENSLRKIIITDPNGNKNATYTDKKGRIVLNASYDGTSLASSSNSKKTYNVYDNKDRLEKVVVPGATLSNTDLNFYYLYDVKDNVIYRKIPSRGEFYYQYNDKNLLATWRDNNIGTTKCMTYSYDDYGRNLKSGFANTPVTVNNPTFSEVHTETIYGTTGIEKGKVKTSKSIIIGTSNWLQTTNTYDGCGRLQSTAGNNHLNINNTTTGLTSAYVYDKGDNVTNINLGIITIPGGTNLPVNYINKFDHIGRNIENIFQYNSGSQTTISKQEYNYREELIVKYQGKTGLTGVNEYLQQINYEYLTNGLLKKINQGQTTGITHYYSCTNPNPTNYSTYNDKDLFYLELYYDMAMPGSSGQVRKNGDIAAMRWQTKGRSYQNYVYTYDYLNQLKEGKYYDYDHGPNQLINNNRFTENVTYDIRGNISTLNRYGVLGPGSCNSVLYLDQLTYNYSSQTGNRIYNISDAKTNTSGAQEFKSATGNFTYDANGNITADPYKGISNILYNHLNKPTQITKSDGSKITFVYDGNGVTLTKSIYNASGTLLEKRDYIGNFEYVGGVLESVMHSEGRYKSVSGTFRHEYAFRDHLGNTRLVYTDMNANGRIDVVSGEILQESHYYPLGLEFKGHYWQSSGFDYRYRFNGIERINDLSLGIDLAFFRGHDPVTGRWLQVDPLADLAPNLNGYRFAFNNPISYTDQLGLFEKKSDAVQYAKDHNLKIGLWGNYRIKQTGDGYWGIYNFDDHFVISDYGDGLGAVTSALITAKPLHLRDIGMDGFYDLSDPHSERFNPNAVVHTDFSDIIYYAGSLAQLVSPSSKFASSFSLAKPTSLATKGVTSEIKVFGSLTEKFGEGYKSVSVARGAYLDIKYGQNLNKISKGVWQKVFEAGSLNGSKVEVHYFYNSATGQYANPYILTGKWASKAFKELK
jgi:RHS repeat-associated protein